MVRLKTLCRDFGHYIRHVVEPDESTTHLINKLRLLDQVAIVATEVMTPSFSLELSKEPGPGQVVSVYTYFVSTHLNSLVAKCESGQQLADTLYMPHCLLLLGGHYMNHRLFLDGAHIL